MLKVILIDDDYLSCLLLEQILTNVYPDVCVIATEGTLAGGAKAIRELPPDIVFLDVELPDGKGFELFNMVDATAFKVIFITAHKDYALPAINFSPAGFLVKPLMPAVIIKTVERIRSTSVPAIENGHNGHNFSDKLVVKTSEKIHLIRKNEIVRCEADKNYTTLFLVNKNKLLVSQTLKVFENLLPYPQFLRIHQSHLINTNYIKCYDKQNNMVVMDDDVPLPLAFRKRESLMAFFNLMPIV